MPQEAHAIADELRAIAQDARDLAGRLRGIDGDLETGWEGLARMRFHAEFSQQPAVAEGASGWLDGEAGRVQSITVERWEIEYEEQWVPD